MEKNTRAVSRIGENYIIRAADCEGCEEKNPIARTMIVDCYADPDTEGGYFFSAE
jgi:hypothetical protein